jgi:two-component system chemotaxis response regulator CheY
MRRILIVDDQANVRELVRQVLEMWDEDLEIEEAEDGLQALFALGQRTYDLMVCDIQMPNLDGVGVLQKVRQTPYHHDLPILMLTGLKDEDNITEALRKGATSYLTKPFNVTELLTALEECTQWDMRNHPMSLPRS